jgi:hypothetical protein
LFENATKRWHFAEKIIVEEEVMGFWSTVGKVASKGYNVAKADLEKKASSYNNSYDRYSERYSDMSDEKLKKEIERLKNNSVGGNSFEKMGRIQAMKDELENRRG